MIGQGLKLWDLGGRRELQERDTDVCTGRTCGIAIMLFQVTSVSGSHLGWAWSYSEPATKLVYP